MSSSSRRRVEEFVRELRRLGYDVERVASGHYKVKRDGKTVASLPATPGGGERCAMQIIRRERKRLGLPV